MTLTEGLVGLAALVLIILVGQGVLASWRARPRVANDAAAGPASAAPAVAATPTARREPGWEGDGPVAATAEPGSTDRAEGEPAPPRLRPTLSLDPLVDAIAEIPLETPIYGEAALAVLPQSRRVGSKPWMAEGLDAESGLWEPVQHGRRYGALQLGVQLANRAGPLNEIEYSEFVQVAQTVAESLGSLIDVPDMVEVVSRARELDAFANAHDAQLAVHIQARSTAWTVGYVEQMCAQHGVVASGLPGRRALPGEGPEAPPLVTVSFDARAALADDPDQAVVRTLALTLDVPQSPEAADPFSAWQRLAAALEQAMDGVAVDEAGRPVQLHQFDGIRGELQTLYAALAARGLAAGSLAARRLFS